MAKGAHFVAQIPQSRLRLFGFLLNRVIDDRCMYQKLEGKRNEVLQSIMSYKIDFLSIKNLALIVAAVSAAYAQPLHERTPRGHRLCGGADRHVPRCRHQE